MFRLRADSAQHIAWFIYMPIPVGVCTGHCALYPFHTMLRTHPSRGFTPIYSSFSYPRARMWLQWVARLMPQPQTLGADGLGRDSQTQVDAHQAQVSGTRSLGHKTNPSALPKAAASPPAAKSLTMGRTLPVALHHRSLR